MHVSGQRAAQVEPVVILSAGDVWITVVRSGFENRNGLNMETKAKTGPPHQVRGHYQALSIQELHVAGYHPPDSSSGSYVSFRYKYTFFSAVTEEASCEQGQNWSTLFLLYFVPNEVPVQCLCSPTADPLQSPHTAGRLLQPHTRSEAMEVKSGTPVSLLAFIWLILPQMTMNGHISETSWKTSSAPISINSKPAVKHCKQ